MNIENIFFRVAEVKIIDNLDNLKFRHWLRAVAVTFELRPESNLFPVMHWDDNATLYKDARKIIRKESNNAYNRLHSISEDAEFVMRIQRFYTNFKIYRKWILKLKE